MLNDLQHIENRIFTFQGQQVMIDSDLAELYQVETKRLNEQVKRNKLRFPKSFRFQLTDNEFAELVANCDRFKKLKHSSSNPYAFTEQGVAMLFPLFEKAHDRFLILDEKTIYHIGASIKDLGKKWFAFSKMAEENLSIMKNLKVLGYE